MHINEAPKYIGVVFVIHVSDVKQENVWVALQHYKDQGTKNKRNAKCVASEPRNVSNWMCSLLTET